MPKQITRTRCETYRAEGSRLRYARRSQATGSRRCQSRRIFRVDVSGIGRDPGMVGIGNTRFRWNATMRLSNLEKHGIDFQDSIVTFGNDAPILPSPREGEMHWLTIGKVDGERLAAAYKKAFSRRSISRASTHTAKPLPVPISVAPSVPRCSRKPWTGKPSRFRRVDSLRVTSAGWGGGVTGLPWGDGCSPLRRGTPSRRRRPANVASARQTAPVVLAAATHTSTVETSG